MRLTNGVSFRYAARAGGAYLEVTSRDAEGHATGLAQGAGMCMNYLTNSTGTAWDVEVTLHCTSSAAEGYRPVASAEARSPEDAVAAARSVLGPPFVVGGDQAG